MQLIYSKMIMPSDWFNRVTWLATSNQKVWFQERVFSLGKVRFIFDIDSCGRCCKTFFGGNLDFPKINKLKKVCSTITNLHKNVKTMLYLAKLYFKTVYYFWNSIFLQIQLRGKSRFSRFPPKKFYNINYWIGSRSIGRNLSLKFVQNWPFIRRRHW